MRMHINRWIGKESHDRWANLTYRRATVHVRPNDRL